MTRRRKPFTGRAALIWVLLFFGVVAMANGIMIWFAFTSDPVRRTEQAAARADIARWQAERISVQGDGRT